VPTERLWQVTPAEAMPPLARLTLPQSIAENAFEVPMAMVLT
jgi:hypothetical protein